ncbi:MAG: radical SAM protein [Deltaproteobacteria bacterium]|nr:radical SAM protein [Deltaproteobacteria bacterium]
MGRSRVEYATDQITVYKPPCPFKCRYCFWNVPLMRARAERIDPRPIEEAIAYARSGVRRTIVVSFTTDPYPYVEQRNRLTRKVLEILSGTRHRVLILTKNPKLALRDLDLMVRNNDVWLGTTITYLYDNNLLEPYAPPASKRLEALYEAHEEGVKTWISIEPILPPMTNVREIVEATSDFVDWYVLGAFNYAKQLRLPEPSRKDYLEVLIPGLEALRDAGKKYLVKRELRELFPRLFA